MTVNDALVELVDIYRQIKKLHLRKAEIGRALYGVRVPGRKNPIWDNAGGFDCIAVRGADQMMDKITRAIDSPSSEMAKGGAWDVEINLEKQHTCCEGSEGSQHICCKGVSNV